MLGSSFKLVSFEVVSVKLLNLSAASGKCNVGYLALRSVVGLAFCRPVVRPLET